MTIINPKTLFTDIDGARLSYLDYDGAGRAMILLHATGFLPWLWHPIARRLSHEYRIIAPYFCDHRAAAPEEGGLSWGELASDLSAFASKLSIKKPLMVGHSMGATVIALAAAFFGLEAEKMILIEPIFLPEDFYRSKISIEDHPLASKSIKRRNFWKDRNDAATYLRSKKLFSNWDDEMLELYLTYGMSEGEGGGLVLTCNPMREAALFMGGMSYNPWLALQKITCPALVLEGRESENRRFIDLKKVASLMPRGEHRIIDGAGHLIPMEKPREIADIIDEYFR